MKKINSFLRAGVVVAMLVLFTVVVGRFMDGEMGIQSFPMVNAAEVGEAIFNQLAELVLDFLRPGRS